VWLRADGAVVQWRITESFCPQSKNSCVEPQRQFLIFFLSCYVGGYISLGALDDFLVSCWTCTRSAYFVVIQLVNWFPGVPLDCVNS
jgi:hypothetical protein